MLLRKTSTRLALVLGLAIAPCSRAEFLMNFTPAGTGVMSTTGIHGGSTITGQTPFLKDGGFELPEIVTDPTNGRSYYHLTVGSMADGFIQEVYIERGFTGFPNGNLGSASAGAGDASGGNGRDPLDVTHTIVTGNGSGNPNRVIIRQLHSDGESMMEFVKDKYDYKPHITHVVNAPDITLQVDIDMRNSTYNNATTPGIMTNTMSLWGPDIPFDSAQFDMATSVQN